MDWRRFRKSYCFVVVSRVVVICLNVSVFTSGELAKPRIDPAYVQVSIINSESFIPKVISDLFQSPLQPGNGVALTNTLKSRICPLGLS